MKPTAENARTSRLPEISAAGQAALGEIFNGMTMGPALSPVQIASEIRDPHRKALAQLAQRIADGEIGEESLQKLLLKHHAADRIIVMEPLTTIIHQISQHLSARRPQIK